MSVNFSSSLPPSPISFPFSVYFYMFRCLNSRAGTYSITAFTILLVLLLLPLCTFVLYLGLQRWRQAASNTTMSHSDVFTYHMVIAELLNVFGFILTSCGLQADLQQTVIVGIYLSALNFSGQTLFHILTCVERYLAVVHPITYLSLRTAKGIRIRNIAIGYVWLMCFACIGFIAADRKDHIDILYFCLIGFIITVVAFCSLSVLCVLIRPGPGEGSGDRQQVDQSKLRAFYTITAILGVLMLRLGGEILSAGLYASPELRTTELCGAWLSKIWFSLPSSLVLPLLYLHRAGKLLCCKHSRESGQGSV